MQVRIENLRPKLLGGKHLTMSLANDKTPELWKSFMQQRSNIKTLNSYLYSLQLLPENYYANFNPAKEFEKWACAEIADSTHLPDTLERFELAGGLYAVFLHKGGPATATRTFKFIFESWFPASEYEYDQRPQFELLGEKYSNSSPDSEEEIWIPIRKKITITNIKT